MNCRSFHKRLVELLDVDPDPVATSDLVEHINICAACAQELAESRALLFALNPSHKACASSNLKERIMNRVTEVESVQYPRTGNWHVPRLARLGLAAVLIFTIILGGNWFANRNGAQSAFAVLAEAAEAVQGIGTMHIRANMRTIEGENFDLIKPDAELVPVEIWMVLGNPQRWRVENPGRIVAMNGESTLILIQLGVGGTLAFKTVPTTGPIGWLSPLLDVEKLLAHEQEVGRKQGARLSVQNRRGPGGRQKVVLTVQAKAQGDFRQSDYRKNKSVIESDNIRVYTFDAQTHRLEDMRVFIDTGAERIMVFEISGIEYDRSLSEHLFKPEVPEDATWCQTPDELVGTARNSWMTPRQAAEAIFSAMANEDWDSLRGFAGSLFDSPTLRELVGGLDVVRIGEPFKSGMYHGWFVPYEIRFKSGETRKHNLAIRNDNPTHQWVFDGGL